MPSVFSTNISNFNSMFESNNICKMNAIIKELLNNESRNYKKLNRAQIRFQRIVRISDIKLN